MQIFCKNIANFLHFAIKNLQKHFQTIDTAQSTVTDGTYLVRAKELDPARALIEIELQGDNVVVVEEGAVGLPDNEINRVRTKHHLLGGGDMDGLHG